MIGSDRREANAIITLARRHLGCSVEKCSQSVWLCHNWQWRERWNRESSDFIEWDNLWAEADSSVLRQSLAACVFNLPRETGDGSHSHPRHGWWLQRLTWHATVGGQWDNLLLSRGHFSSAHSKYSWDFEETEETITLAGHILQCDHHRYWF